MQTISWSIRGLSPLLMHRFPMDTELGIEKKPPKYQAQRALYQLNGSGTIYLPAENLRQALVGGGVYSKGKGRATLTKTIAAILSITPDALTISPQKWEIDSRPVVITATRGRIVRHRPRFDQWTIGGKAIYDDTVISEAQLREVFDNAGSRVGVGDFRPAKRGPCGRFMVTAWAIV